MRCAAPLDRRCRCRLTTRTARRRGGPVEVIRPGDRVFFEPGEEHWHGAAPNRFMTHLAMLQVDEEGNSATWGAHVTDQEYGAPPALDG